LYVEAEEKAYPLPKLPQLQDIRLLRWPLEHIHATMARRMDVYPAAMFSPRDDPVYPAARARCSGVDPLDPMCEKKLRVAMSVAWPRAATSSLVADESV
jgi:hypothetical protein